MTETTSQVTSDAKLCTDCGAAFGDEDDRRFKMCAACRNPTSAPPEAPAGMDVPTTTTDEPPFTETDPPTTVETPPEGGLETITFEHDAAVVPPPVPKNFWLCGVTDDAPVNYATLGGINFQKWRGEVRAKGGATVPEFVDNVAPGMVHRLAKEQIDLITLHAKSKVVRGWRKDFLGNRTEITDENDPTQYVYLGDVLSTNGQPNKPYEPQPGDIPLGCFVYMVKVQSRDERPAFPNGEAPTMVKRPEGLTPA